MLWGIALTHSRLAWGLGERVESGGYMSVLEKVRKLVALAKCPSASSEEARNAAMAAINLIDANKLLDAVKEPPSNTQRLNKPSTKRPRVELRREASSEVERLLKFLQLKAVMAVFPFVRARDLAERAVESGRVDRADLTTYLYYLRQALRAHKAVGSMEYHPGKGYRCAYAQMWENAA